MAPDVVVTGDNGKPVRKEWEAIQVAEAKLKKKQAKPEPAKKRKKKSTAVDQSVVIRPRKRANLVQLPAETEGPSTSKLLRPLAPKPMDDAALSSFEIDLESPGNEFLRIVTNVSLTDNVNI